MPKFQGKPLRIGPLDREKDIPWPKGIRPNTGILPPPEIRPRRFRATGPVIQAAGLAEQDVNHLIAANEVFQTAGGVDRFVGSGSASGSGSGAGRAGAGRGRTGWMDGGGLI